MRWLSTKYKDCAALQSSWIMSTKKLNIKLNLTYGTSLIDTNLHYPIYQPSLSRKLAIYDKFCAFWYHIVVWNKPELSFPKVTKVIRTNLAKYFIYSLMFSLVDYIHFIWLCNTFLGQNWMWSLLIYVCVIPMSLDVKY